MINSSPRNARWFSKLLYHKGTAAATLMLLAGCNKSESGAPYRAPYVLTRAEVLSKFRERASPEEVDDFERLAAAASVISQDRAKEIVLFKLTTDELLHVGIAQTEGHGHYFWSLATQYKPSTGASRAFEQALKGVGIEAGGVMGLGRVGWSVPREQFFTARRALLAANLLTNEIRIIEPEFQLR